MAYRGNFPFGPVGGPGMFGLRREIDRLFEDAFGGNAGNAGNGQGGRAGAQGGGQSYTPAVDAREEARDVVLHMDLPGVRPEDVELSVENGLLTVRGQRHQQRKEGQEGRYQFVERSHGSFVRQFHLPQGVDESQISADFEHGELTIRIPKPQQPQPRRIRIGRATPAGQQQASVTSGAAGGAAGARGAAPEAMENSASGAMGAGAGGSPAAGAGALGGALNGSGGAGATGTMAGSDAGRGR